MIVKLLTEHHLVFQSLKGGCTGSSELKCYIVGNLMHWLSHAFIIAHMFLVVNFKSAFQLSSLLSCAILLVIQIYLVNDKQRGS